MVYLMTLPEYQIMW